MIYNDSKFNKDWPIKRLSELGVFGRGVSKHRPRNDVALFRGGGYPLVQTSEVKNSNLYITRHSMEYNQAGLSQSKLWDSGTLCITIAANIADTSILSYPMCFPDSIVGFTADKKQVSPEYMHYAFAYIKNSILNTVSGSIQDNINLETLESLSLRVPEKSYQTKVLSILESIDKKINNNDIIREKLNGLATTIYEHWFLQFDFPDDNGRPYKSSGGEMVYDGVLEREIPKGWKVKDIGNIIKEAKKSSIQVNEAKKRPGNYPFFTSGDEIVDFDDFYVDGFNIFLNTGGNADVKGYYGKSAYSTDTWCVSATDYSYLLFIFLCSIKEYLNDNCFAGSGLKHLQKNVLKQIKIVCPDNAVLERFNNQVESIYKNISSLQIENKKLASIRDWLLPMLMNGQIKVSD